MEESSFPQTVLESLEEIAWLAWGVVAKGVVEKACVDVGRGGRVTEVAWLAIEEDA